MVLEPSGTTAVLLVVCGVALLWAAVAMPGVQSAATYEYTAAELVPQNGTIAVVDESTGERIGSSLRRRVLDDRVLCFFDYGRACAFERAFQNGTVSTRHDPGRFEYMYAGNQTFYHLVPGEPMDSDRPEHERRNASEAFSNLAVDQSFLVPAERRVLEDGSALVTGPVPHHDRVVSYEGNYYVFLRTGYHSTADGGSFCSWSGEGDFCSDAEFRRTILTWRNRFLGLLGAVALFVGGLGLVRTRRSSAAD